MKRIYIENEFTQWAEYLARYFGHDLLIYDTNGDLMWGSPAQLHIEIEELLEHDSTHIVMKDIGQPIAYLNSYNLTASEEAMLLHIIPFIESQLDDNEGA